MTDTYDPTANLPDGVVLTRETYSELMDLWVANGGEALTSAQIEGVVGSGQSAPTIKRSFPTGEHPDAGRNPFYSGSRNFP